MTGTEVIRVARRRCLFLGTTVSSAFSVAIIVNPATKTFHLTPLKSSQRAECIIAQAGITVQPLNQKQTVLANTAASASSLSLMAWVIGPISESHDFDKEC